MPKEQVDKTGAEAAQASTETLDNTVLIFGCPARDEMDELALYMFRHLLNLGKCRFQIISHNKLTAEIISQVQSDQPKAVCIVTLPPKGLTHTRYLCKRLRGQFPELKILAGCWGLEQNFGEARERLLAAGANQVGSSLLETRAQLIPLVQLEFHIQRSEDRVAGTAAAADRVAG